MEKGQLYVSWNLFEGQYDVCEGQYDVCSINDMGGGIYVVD